MLYTQHYQTLHIYVKFPFPFYVLWVGWGYISAVFSAALAPMSHLWNYLLAFHLQLYKNN